MLRCETASRTNFGEGPLDWRHPIRMRKGVDVDSPTLVGFVDSVSMSGRMLRISGWVTDARSRDESLQLLVRADDGGEVVTIADLPRPDLLQVSISNIMAGFDVELPVSRAVSRCEIHARGPEGWQPFHEFPVDTRGLNAEPTEADVMLAYLVLFSRQPTEEELARHLGDHGSIEGLVDDLLQSNETLRVNGDWMRVLKSSDPDGL